MLGLAGLVFAIKFWKEDLEKAVAKILEWLTKAYEYFTAEDFTFDKFKTDLTTKFLPAIRDFLFDALNWLWGAIKGVAIEWMFGAQGDKAVRQQAGQASAAKTNIAKFNLSEEALESSPMLGMDKTGLSEANQESLIDEHKSLVENMLKISRESDWRIQWTGIDKFGKWNPPGAGRVMADSIPFNQALAAQPIVDGKIMQIKDLETIKLQELGGITKGMDDEKQASIRAALAEKTALLHEKMMLSNQKYDKNYPQSFNEFISSMLPGGQTGEDAYNEAKALRLKEIENEIITNAEAIKYSGQQFVPTDDSLSVTPTNGSGQKLNNAKKDPPPMVAAPFINASTNDNSTKVVNQGDNVSLAAMNINPTNEILNELYGVRTKLS
jgi:hypothetical protein